MDDESQLIERCPTCNSSVKEDRRGYSPDLGTRWYTCGDIWHNDKSNGVWFVYGRDMHAYPVGIFNDELEARRSMDTYNQVIFWEFGKNWDDLDGT